MKVAALQMVSGMDLPANLRTSRSLLAEAAAQGAELALLPEYFSLLGPHERSKLAVQETPGSGPVQDFLSQAAHDFKLWLVGGTLPLATSDPLHARNASLAFDPQGRCVARYDKMHLFRFADGSQDHDESRTLSAGNTPVSFDLPSRDGHTWRVGLSICYDLRFAELYRALAADLLLVPSAFTHTTGQAHWDVLLRARAIDNLAYVLAAAQAGLHENGRRTWGHSLVLGELDAARLARVREQLPALTHRVL
jgi:nitrilase